MFTPHTRVVLHHVNLKRLQSESRGTFLWRLNKESIFTMRTYSLDWLWCKPAEAHRRPPLESRSSAVDDSTLQHENRNKNEFYIWVEIIHLQGWKVTKYCTQVQFWDMLDHPQVITNNNNDSESDVWLVSEGRTSMSLCCYLINILSFKILSSLKVACCFSPFLLALHLNK